jgi:DNA-binding MarR family transcriptional regulator
MKKSRPSSSKRLPSKRRGGDERSVSSYAPDQLQQRRYRVFLSSRDLASTRSSPGGTDFVIAESVAHITVVTARLFDRRLAMRLRRYGVPIGQWPFLLFLWANEDLSQRELSKLMAIEESTVTNTIDRMARDGLISRIRTPLNRRRNQLRLTDRGRKLLDTLLPEAMEVVKTAARGMSDVELAFLVTLLKKVQVNLADQRAGALSVEPRADGGGAERG